MVLVDTNVLIDVAAEDPAWFDWSAGKLAALGSREALAINPVIYAEFSVHFDTVEQVEDVLADFRFERLGLPWEAAFLAGKAFRLYRRRGGKRAAPLPDFFIGAHAAVAGISLLTRDPRRFRDYFPRLKLIAPN
jgi:predicted nucleic acid-binding protein